MFSGRTEHTMQDKAFIILLLVPYISLQLKTLEKCYSHQLSSLDRWMNTQKWISKEWECIESPQMSNIKVRNLISVKHHFPPLTQALAKYLWMEGCYFCSAELIFPSHLPRDGPKFFHINVYYFQWHQWSIKEYALTSVPEQNVHYH